MRSFGFEPRHLLLSPTEIALLKQQNGDGKEIEKLKGQVATENAYHKAYLAGMQQGMQLATGNRAAIVPPPSASLVGSGSGSRSSDSL